MLWKTAAALASMICVTACVSAGSGEAICEATARLRTDHAAALAQDGGNLSVETGYTLISALDAGCGD